VLIPALKSALQSCPYPVGRALASVPYRWRLPIGRAYTAVARHIDAFDLMGVDEQRHVIVRRVRHVVEGALEIPFFRSLYAKHGITSATSIRTLEDVSHLPVVDKDLLRSVPLSERSRPHFSRYRANTGGTSGSPLDFYITASQVPNEWAHMHRIWTRLGYRTTDLKLVFAGRPLGDRPIVYDGLRHSYQVNAYAPTATVLAALRDLVAKRQVRYLHGYPSAIVEFASAAKEADEDLHRGLRGSLRGILLGSEYPVPHQRREIEETFGVPTISWYGHTERAVLAGERGEQGVYHPFQTYGYCEAVPVGDTGNLRLVASSYHNSSCPFIRYDTGDEIESVDVRGGILRSFRVAAGRIGDYVIDRAGTKISLTALVFGRHHALFDVARFVQIRQLNPGTMTVVITPRSEFPSAFELAKWFDVSALNMTVEHEVVSAPIRTTIGKVGLKLTQ